MEALLAAGFGFAGSHVSGTMLVSQGGPEAQATPWRAGWDP